MTPQSRWRQTLLCQRADGTLCFMAHLRLSPGETTTARLPLELLSEILKYVTYSYKHKEISILMTVCRRWHQILEPLAYRQLSPGYGSTALSRANYMRQLLERLESCPSLRRYPQEMNILFINGCVIAQKFAIRLVRLCPNVRILQIKGALGPTHLPLLEAAARLPLQELTLHSLQKGFPASLIVELFDMPILKRLRLHRYGFIDSSVHGVRWPKADSLGPLQPFFDKCNSCRATKRQLEGPIPKRPHGNS